MSAPRNGSCLRRVIRRGADRDKTALEMERLDAETRFDTLVAAARKYLADGRDPASLTPLAVQKLGLLPPNWVSDPDVATNNGLWLGPRDGGLIGVGVVGSYEALAPLMERQGLGHRAHRLVSKTDAGRRGAMHAGLGSKT